MKRIALSLVIAMLAALSGPVAGANPTAWTARAAEYPGINLQRDVRITMSDGVRLTADVILPADASGAPVAGTFPAILIQTPYNKNALHFRQDGLTTRGYVQVVAEVRGTGSSQGVWDSFGTREQLDGPELIAWIRRQPWSNGDVGLAGTSYGAINQLFTAAQRPEGLKAIFPIVPMADAYRDIAVSGGQLNTSFIPLWLGLVTALGVVPPTYIADDPSGAAGALASHAAGVLNFQANTVARAVAGSDTAFDGPFYRVRSPIEVVDRIEVPTFMVGGLYDLFQRGTPMLFERLQANGVETKLLHGPWYHITAGQGLPADGIPPTFELALSWYDKHLRGADESARVDQLAPVTYWRINDGHFHESPTWPPPDVSAEERYLTTGGMSETAPAGDPDLVLWQPASGACSRSSVQWTAGGGEGGPCETDNRLSEVGGAVYDLPLTEELQLAGPIAARLFVSTTGEDAFVTARVSEVDAEGRSSQLSAGWNVLSMRAVDMDRTQTLDGLVVRPYHPFTADAVQDVLPETVYELWVEIFPTAAVLPAGHTLRLSIQPSDAPHLSAPVPQAARMAGSIMRIYHDDEHPSSLVLPVQ